MYNPASLFFLLFVLLYSCNARHNEKTLVQEEVKGRHAEEVRYARGFGIYHYEDYSLLELYSPFRDSDDTLRYVVGSTGNSKFPADYRIIDAPVSNVVLLASTHATFLEKLNRINIVKGISTKSYFFNKNILAKVESGDIVELGFGQNINSEKLMILNPQLLVFSGMSTSDVVRYSHAHQAGVVLFPAAEWQEQHPLGRAEWIKVFGLLTGQYESSTTIFDQIEENYLKLTEKKFTTKRPTVIVNAPFKDVWWLPGGNSYVSKLIEDAEATYMWHDNEQEGGIQIDIETIFHQAHDADFWINPGQFKSIRDLLAQDSRYSEFSALRNKNVYNSDLRINSHGGNDYYETGVVRPDLILADLIKIFHPDALPGHEFYFYRKLP